MDESRDLITVYRSADANGEDDVAGVHEELVKAGYHPITVNDNAPGVPPGSWEVRVPTEESMGAEEVIATLNSDDPHETDADPSHELDLVTVATTDGAAGEMQAISIRSVLEANGLAPVIVGASTLPNLGFEIRVPATQAEQARQAIAEAEAAGSAAAIQGERETE